VVSDTQRHPNTESSTGIALPVDNNNTSNNNNNNDDDDKDSCIVMFSATNPPEAGKTPPCCGRVVSGARCQSDGDRYLTLSRRHSCTPAADDVHSNRAVRYDAVDYDAGDSDDDNATENAPAKATLISANNNSAAAVLDRVSRRRRSGSRRGPSRGGGGRSQRSAAALKATSCPAMEADAFLRQLEADRLRPDADLLARVLDEYRRLLGHDETPSVKAAWRLARLPAGQWLVGEVRDQVDRCLRDVQSSKLCRAGRLSTRGAALCDGDRLTSRLTESVSAEIKDVVLQRAVAAVVQALVNMTSPQRHRRRHQQSVCQRCSALEVPKPAVDAHYFFGTISFDN